MTESSIRAGSHALRNALTGVKEIVEIDVDSTDLEPDDCSKWRSIGRKASVVFVDIIAIRDGSVDRRGVRRGYLGRTRFWIAPRALLGPSAVAAFSPKLAFHKGSDGLLHGFVIRRAERSE